MTQSKTTKTDNAKPKQNNKRKVKTTWLQYQKKLDKQKIRNNLAEYFLVFFICMFWLTRILLLHLSFSPTTSQTIFSHAQSYTSRSWKKRGILYHPYYLHTTNGVSKQPAKIYRDGYSNCRHCLSTGNKRTWSVPMGFSTTKKRRGYKPIPNLPVVDKSWRVGCAPI